jgi:uncharacterized spore protein YtfJ
MKEEIKEIIKQVLEKIRRASDKDNGTEGAENGN